MTATTVGNLALQVLKAAEPGRVCGVFSAGLAIEFGGLAIMLSTDSGGWPLGIGLSSLPATLRREWIGLAAGSSLTSLELKASGWRVDLRQAVVWDGGRALKDLAPSSSALSSGSSLARSWLSDYSSASGASGPGLSIEPPVLPAARLVGGAFERHIASALSQVIHGLHSQEEAAWSAGVEALLGVGPGLTPAGDDVLAGLVLALQSASPSSIAALPELLTLIRRRAAMRTTLYGYSALHAACLGQAPEVVVRALDALFAFPAAVHDRLAALVRVGATSGYDTLLGLSAGLGLLVQPSSPD